MLAAERRRRVVDLVRSSTVVSTEELAEALDVSAETIRRDLLELEKRGSLVRVHGGATVVGPSAVASEPPFDVRSEEHLGRKRSIAAAAAALVPSGSLTFIDVGTTALLVARALPEALEATIVTTSLRVAVELADRPGLDVIVAGGSIRTGDLAIYGSLATSTVAGMHFDVALLGSGGLHPTAGLTDYYLEEIDTRRAVIRQSATSFVICDATKFDKIARFHVADLGGFTGVVADEKPGARLAEALDASATKVIAAGAP